MKILPLNWHGTGGDLADDRLRDLARDVRRLSPDRRDPEKFFIQRDEIAAEMQRLAASLAAPATPRADAPARIGPHRQGPA